MALSDPLRLVPRVKEVVWGGQWLATELGRPGDANAKLGESWEAYSGSVVAEGAFVGRTLGELFTEFGPALFGSAAAHYSRFPLLAKFIEARDNLSIQVHPDDALAMQLENYPFGKTEFWYVLEAPPGTEVIYGLAAEFTDREQLKQALAAQDLLPHCLRVPVRPGDVVFIPAGTVHALTHGVIIYEVQQDSDITYRLYDWGRTGREMHLEKGLQAIDLSRHSLPVTHPVLSEQEGFAQGLLAESAYFHSELLRIDTRASLPGLPHSFVLLSVVDGQGTLTADGQANKGSATATMTLHKGDTALVPAGRSYTLQPAVPTPTFSVVQSRLP